MPTPTSRPDQTRHQSTPLNAHQSSIHSYPSIPRRPPDTFHSELPHLGSRQLHLVLRQPSACSPSPSSLVHCLFSIVNSPHPVLETCLLPCFICSRTRNTRALYLEVPCRVLHHAFPSLRTLHRRLVDVVGFVGSPATPNPRRRLSFLNLAPKTSKFVPSVAHSIQLLAQLPIIPIPIPVPALGYFNTPSIGFMVDKPRYLSNCAIDIDMYPRAATST